MLRFKKQKPVGRNVLRKPGSQRSPVFSYYNNRPADVGSTRQASRRKFFSANRAQTIDIKHHLRHVPTYIAAVLIIGSLVYASTVQTRPKVLIGRTQAENSLLRTSTVYEQQIQALLNRSLFNRSKLTINTEKLEREIRQGFPEIQEATVSIPLLGRRPIVGLTPSEPTLMLEGSSGTFIIGQDGRALLNVKDSARARAPKLPLLKDESNIQIEQGKAALPKEHVEYITTVMQQLKAKNIAIKAMQLPAIINELRITPDGKNYYVKFNLASDARQQVGTYLAVKEKLESDRINPAEYIDVRVAERAYYK